MHPCTHGMAWVQLLKRLRIFEYGGYTPQRGEVSARFCALAPGACVRYLFLLCGANPHENLERRLLPLIMQYYPSGSSTHNMEHWGQVRRCNSWLPCRSLHVCMCSRAWLYNQMPPPMWGLHSPSSICGSRSLVLYT